MPELQINMREPSERFLPSMEALVDLFALWQDEEGRWRDQIGSFLAAHGRTAEGIFYYKESPISENPHSSTAMLKDLFAFLPLLEKLDLLGEYRGPDIAARLQT